MSRKYNLKDLVCVDKNFQNSINLSLDGENSSKISRYIPTTSSMEILSRYADTILEDDGNEKATSLIGPYGKGKSHLILVLLNIINRNAKNQEDIEVLLQKIEKKDSDLSGKLRSILKKEIKMLPVIINYAKEDLMQSFLVALNDALKNHDLTHIRPATYYSEAITTIEKWREEYRDTYEAFVTELRERSMDIDTFIKELDQCNEDTYNTFCSIYPKLTSGSIFNPMISINPMEVYKAVNDTLIQEYGYTGMFIVFDEFSKYIENNNRNNVSGNMKIIQDMCELSNASGKKHIHIVFISHKSIREYGDVLDKKIINAFTGVEGRFTEIMFVTSSKNNYELIENVIIKNEELDDRILKDIYTGNRTTQEYYRLADFRSLYGSLEEFEKRIVRGCFPLNPFTAFALLNISERVAQNERTLFTYISKNEKYSMARHIEEDTEDGILSGTDTLYDYFEKQFKKDVFNKKIHSEWVKASYAVKCVENPIDKKVIKAIAVINMLGRTDIVKANERTIALAVNESEEAISDSISRLEELNIIVYRMNSAAYDFISSIDTDISKEIDKEAARRFADVDIVKNIPSMIQTDYAIPRRYNSTYFITRYFEYKYMNYDVFMLLPDSNALFSDKFADGKIVVLVDENNVADISKVQEKLEELDDIRILAVVADTPFAYRSQLTKILAAKSLKYGGEFEKNNRAAMQDLYLYEEDALYAFNKNVMSMYDISGSHAKLVTAEQVYSGLKNSEFNELLSSICEKYYDKTPKINNELINRHEISAPIRKARNQIADMLLQKADMSVYDTGTSPEATIYRASIKHPLLAQGITDNGGNITEIMEWIDEFIRGCEGKKESFAALYERLLGIHYGMRKGVIPIYIAYCLAKLNDIPVIYFKNKEVQITGEVLNNVNDRPEDYYLWVEKGVVSKQNYLDGLEKLYMPYRTSSTSSNRLCAIVDSMARWYRSLPQYATTYDTAENTQIKAFRKLFATQELNPADILFIKLPKICSEDNNYDRCLTGILKIKNTLDGFISATKARCISGLKQELSIDDGKSLENGLKDWYMGLSDKVKSYIFDAKTNEFLSFAGGISKNEENINYISRILLGIYIEDWNDDSYGEFFKAVRKIKEEIEEITCKNGQKGSRHLLFTTSDGKVAEKYFEADVEDSNCDFFRNEISAVMENIGEAVDVNQKIAILLEFAEKLMGSKEE